MLKVCAPGAEIREKPHHYWVIYKKKIYPSLPKGEHGAGDRAELQIGKVRHMIRDLGIDEDCALARLGLTTKAKTEKKTESAASAPQPKNPVTHS